MKIRSFHLFYIACVFSSALTAITVHASLSVTPTPTITPTCMPCWPYITIDGVDIDDTLGECYDGDGIPDAGEQVGFRVTGSSEDGCCWGPGNRTLEAYCGCSDFAWIETIEVSPPDSICYEFLFVYFVDYDAQCLDECWIYFLATIEDFVTETDEIYIPLVLEVDDDGAGGYICDVMPCEGTATPQCIHHGDVDGNNTITAMDAMLSFNIALGLYTPSYTEWCAADCNSDGEVTAGDAYWIFIMALGGDGCADPLP